jgi:hypothetical protein
MAEVCCARSSLVVFCMHMKFLLFLVAISICGMNAATAGDKVRIALYLGTNAPNVHEDRLAPEKLHHRLHAVFGFKHYELIKGEDIELRHEWEQWFVPRRDFFMRVLPLPHEPGEPRMCDFEIYKDGFFVAKGRFEAREDTPLFVNGPDFQDGRFILVLESR